MSIDFIKISALSFPLKKPIKTNIHVLNTIEGIELHIYDSSGFEGKSFTRGFGAVSYKEIIYSIGDLEKVIRDNHISMTFESWNQFWNAYRQKKTVAEIYALAVWDIAVWDLIAKKMNKSLYQLLTDKPLKKVPVYGTTGWLSLTEDELITECKIYANLGVNGFKIRLGHEQDYHRVKAVRKAMPYHYTLMLDANERFSVSEAIQVAKKMADLNIAWFEEPCKSSWKDLQEVAKKSPISIASGENIFDVVDFIALSKHKAVNILQPDILCCGGITGFVKVADAISLYPVKLCNHLYPELSVSLISSYENSYFLEYDNLLPPDIFMQTLTIKEGYMDIPQTIGNGFELTQDTLINYRIQ